MERKLKPGLGSSLEGVSASTANPWARSGDLFRFWLRPGSVSALDSLAISLGAIIASLGDEYVFALNFCIAVVASIVISRWKRESTPSVLPGTESLKTTLARVQPYWEDRIAPEILQGRDVLVAAHGNSLRALVKMLEGISDDEITEVNIPTGVPRLYELDEKLKPTRAEYLGDAAAIAAAAEAVANQAKAKK